MSEQNPKVILVMAAWAVAGCAEESSRELAHPALECPACVNEALAFSYTRPEAALMVGTSFSSTPSNLSPTTPYAFSVSTPLPAGLTLDGVTGAITGTAAVPTAGRMYRIDALSTASWRVASVWIEVVTSPQTSPQQYFVSLSGNDANPGTFSQPWKTIARGL